MRGRGVEARHARTSRPRRPGEEPRSRTTNQANCQRQPAPLLPSGLSPSAPDSHRNPPAQLSAATHRHKHDDDQGHGLGMRPHASPPVGNSTLPRRSFESGFRLSIAISRENSIECARGSGEFCGHARHRILTRRLPTGRRDKPCRPRLLKCQFGRLDRAC